MLTSPGPVIISPGAMVFSPALAGAARADKTVDYPYVSLATSNSVSDLVAMLARKNDRYVIEPSSALTLTEIRGRPVVLLGVYNNEWTQREFDELRFRFAPQATRKIYDSANPTVTWTRPALLPYSEADDYAIIARFYSSLTRSPVLVLGGIGKNGTEAATQFVTDPRYLSSLERSLPKGWYNKNIEFVIKTKVIDGRTGEPTLEAVHLW